MPIGSPFTRLCQSIARPPHTGRADLHVHTNHSDGEFTPQEVIARATKAGLSAVAITDHDTLSGLLVSRDAKALRSGVRSDSTTHEIELIPGVEITAEFQGRELHLLGYFVDSDHADLSRALAEVRFQRSERFEAIAGRLRGAGLSIESETVRTLRENGASLGRRHMAKILIETRQAWTIHEAFSRHLCKPEIAQLPKHRLPIAEAIELVRTAGGVSSWAHPPADATIDQMRELQALGLNAVECEYPWARPSHGKRLREMAEVLGLAITGGSDCHGAQPNGRAIGVRGIIEVELESLRGLAASICRASIG